MTDQDIPTETTEELPPLNVSDSRIFLLNPKIPCPGGCGEMIEDGTTHRPWACAAAKAGHSGEMALLVNGVTWCSTHSDFQYNGFERCYRYIVDPDTPCVPHELFYFGAKP
jgi:hypothetical protein